MILRRPAVLCAVVVVATTAFAIGGAVAVPTTDATNATTTPTNDPLVVATDGSAEYDTIGAALADAGDGDRILVRPGTYREALTLDANVTLIAPRGATLNGSTLADRPTALRIPRRSSASPAVDGFTITGYGAAFQSREARGDWVLRDLVIRNSGDGINAPNGYGDWRVERTVVRGASVGVSAPGSHGDWTVRDVLIQDVHEGVNAAHSDGNWTIENVRVEGATFTLLWASDSTGDWEIRNATFRDGREGLAVDNTTGDWCVVDTMIAEVHAQSTEAGDGSALYTASTRGAWTVQRSALVNTTGPTVEAPGADPAGTITRVWWGEEGLDCDGNVRCADPLATPPKRSTPLGTVTDPTATVLSNQTTSRTATISATPATESTIITSGRVTIWTEQPPLTAAVLAVVAMAVLLATRQ